MGLPVGLMYRIALSWRDLDIKAEEESGMAGGSGFWSYKDKLGILYLGTVGRSASAKKISIILVVLPTAI